MRLTVPQERELRLRFYFACTTCLIPISMWRGRRVRCRSLIKLGLLAEPFPYRLTAAGIKEGLDRYGDVVVAIYPDWPRRAHYYSMACQLWEALPSDVL